MTEQSRASIYLQRGSRLFQLPQELRDEIYSLYFSSVELEFVYTYVELKTQARAVDDLSLALLRACRRARDEIGDRWISQVWFSFLHGQTVLDSPIPNDKWSKMRRLRILNLLDDVWLDLGEDDRYYGVTSVLKLLPGLQLDELVLHWEPEPLDGVSMSKWDAIWRHPKPTESRFSPKHEYWAINTLVTESDGWKELRYMSPPSKMLAWRTSPGAEERGRLGPQPELWGRLLSDRDGASSKPSVTIHRHNIEYSLLRTGQQPSPEQTVRFEQEMAAGVPLQDYQYMEDNFLLDENEVMKPMTIVVKRGAGVDYEVKAGSPLIPLDVAPDIRRDFPGMTWEQIREDQLSRSSMTWEQILEESKYLAADYGPSTLPRDRALKS
jgi:hypothetical protein